LTVAYDFSMAKSYLHISPEGCDHLFDEMPARGLLGGKRLEEMLRKTGELVQAHDLKLPGSFFGTSLGHLMLTKMFFLCMYGKALRLSLDGLTFQIDYEEGHGHPHIGYRIDDVRAEEFPEEGGDEFVLDDWKTFIADNAVPAVRSIAEAAKMKPETIWAQFGSLGGLLADFVKGMPLPREVSDRFRHHFRLLSESISPETFGTRRNPFKWNARYVENPMNPEEPWLMRSACCLYDQRDGGEKCYVCPKLTEEERVIRKQRYQTSAV